MKREKNDKYEKRGILSVVGRNCIEIPIGSIDPRRVKVKFIDHDHHVPCDIRHDKLSYNLVRRGHQFYLFIEWSVSGKRTIEWQYR